ncbi:unnamed protein product [Rhizoctonia solani]|uniref:Uncharacterized protein n=1 Tax=Rhizoctonia solani TaxID=456999 RepID=A0A8H3H5J5_9AGAM|nr:unnamed protein product [Rhizoctonia solani]CAE6483856.1 unnamed protein product [Rhizoctonia solani]
MAAPTSAASKKLRRPVLSSHVAHAHAFAAVPSPGAPKSAGSSYFPLPTPPAPLRTFAVYQNGDTNASTSYPASVEDPGQQARINTHLGETLREATPCTSSSSRVRQGSDAPPKSPLARPPSTSSQYQFASASFSRCTPTRSSGFSSSSSTSARSALSIAEIDCFFVQGSRSSAYAARSNSSSQSRPPSEPGGGSASLSELGMSSNEEAGSTDVWTSDEAERERRREERKAFMQARQQLREDARRKKRQSTGGLNNDAHTATWREVIQAQTVMPLKGIPESRTSSSRGPSASGSPRGIQHAMQSGEPLADMLRAPPLPSGPGPPPEPDDAVNTLAATLSKSMATSDPIPDEHKRDPGLTPPTDGTPPTLNRFDSGKTAVGIPAIISPVD